jgi:hypothetical protein
MVIADRAAIGLATIQSDVSVYYGAYAFVGMLLYAIDLYADFTGGIDITEYTSKLGEPSGGYYEAKSCAFEGMDKFYYYDSVTLQGYQKDGNDKLYSITLMDDAVKTKEGVRIGDKKDKVVSAYGSDYTEADGQLLYESGNTRLSFVMKDDEVQSIIYSVK